MLGIFVKNALPIKLVSIILVLLFGVLISNFTIAQVRCKTMAPLPFKQQLDSLQVLLGSVTVNGSKVNSTLFDAKSNTINLNSFPDSVLVCYRVLPFKPSEKIYKYNLEFYDSGYYSSATHFNYQHRHPISTGNNREQLLQIPNINKSGVISRGISVGNQQNVFVNSELNLKLEGHIAQDVKLIASFSDRNIPIQPEGNTAQIQDFDRIFVKLEHRRASLSAGDIILQNKNTHFLRYYKNIQGAQGQLLWNENKGQTEMGVAVAKGKFYSQQIQAAEGVQGPYRLTGPQGQRFVIIIANTERVFIDGKQLRRGFNYDYTIDYNRAEIIFNNNILITAFTRIRVDFEYIESNFARSIVQGSHRQTFNPNLNVGIEIYREVDNPNDPAVTLDSAARSLLASAGDKQGLSAITGITPTPYTTDIPLYRVADTLTPDGDSVFVYSPQPAPVLYRVVFTQTTANAGDYIVGGTTGFGRYYTYVGKGNGDYLPLRAIPAPNSKNMTVANFDYKNNRTKVFGEVAFTDYDKNRLSGLNDADNNGGGLRLNFNHQFDTLNGYIFYAGGAYEGLTSNFEPIDRFRPIEFDRDWSAPTADSAKATDHLFELNMGVNKNADNFFKTSVARRHKQGFVNGWQPSALFSVDNRLFNISGNAFLLHSESTFNKSKWVRLTAQTVINNKYIKPGYRFQTDQNQLRLKSNLDSVTATAMFFNQHTIFASTTDTNRLKNHIEFSQRTDFSPILGKMKPSLESETYQATSKLQITDNHLLAINATYRKLKWLNTTNTNEENVMGRADHVISWFSNSIRSELNLSVGTGRELLREYQYLRTPNVGEGTHYWHDLNNNNIAELDEFFEAARPEDRLFYRVFIPTDQYVNAYINEANYRLNLEPPREWRNNQQFTKFFLSKISAVIGYTSNYKTTANTVAGRLIPMFGQYPQNELLSRREVNRATLFFNRSAKFGGDFQFLNSNNRNLLTQGFETYTNTECRPTARGNLGTVWSFRATGLNRNVTRNSDFLLNRSYTIASQGATGELSYQPNNEYRLSGGTQYLVSNASKFNGEFLAESENVQYYIEGRLSKVSKAAYQGRIAAHNVTYRGDLQSPVAYEMLESLAPGVNITWNLSLQTRLANGLQLNINYEGRNSPNRPTVHMGRLQLSALL